MNTRPSRLRVLAAAAVLFSAAAGAEVAVTTGAVNMRAGPDTSYPVVTTLGSRVVVNVVGCLESFAWCDVVVGPNRGWVSAQYLAYDYQNQPTVIGYGGPTLGLPLITFSIGNYWDNYYRSRPWYRERDYWYRHRVAPAPAWRPPHGRYAEHRDRDWNRGRGDDSHWNRERGNDRDANRGRGNDRSDRSNWNAGRGGDRPRVTAEQQ